MSWAWAFVYRGFILRDNEARARGIKLKKILMREAVVLDLGHVVAPPGVAPAGPAPPRPVARALRGARPPDVPSTALPSV